MFKDNLLNSCKSSLRLILVVVGLFVLMVLFHFLSGGSDAALSYVESINIRELIAPVFAFFIVVAFLPPAVIFLVSRNKK
jgi:succinate dehydrogenase hydrophobic anchor subunit